MTPRRSPTIAGDRVSEPVAQPRDPRRDAFPERTIPVAPGRNLAVLVEAAVRAQILRAGGYSAPRDLVEKHNRALAGASSWRGERSNERRTANGHRRAERRAVLRPARPRARRPQAPPRPARRPRVRLTIVTGLSGSGKSVALHSLEDEGFYCIDNLPAALLPPVIDRLLGERAGPLRAARDRHRHEKRARLLGRSPRAPRRPSAPATDMQVEVLFLDTDRSTLVTRFSETRRKHPLSSRDLTLIAAIDEEARLLEPVKGEAELVVDTSQLNLHELRDIIRTYLLGRSSASLSLIFQSFGFKHGAPASTDFTFDVRCLPNPHWEPELRPFTGREAPIVAFLEEQPDVADMLGDIVGFLERWLPLFEAENRAYLTVSVGCTGGRHRSVYLVERLAAHFGALRDNVSLRHRELA